MWAVLNFLVIVNNATVNICGDDFLMTAYLPYLVLRH